MCDMCLCVHMCTLWVCMCIYMYLCVIYGCEYICVYVCGMCLCVCVFICACGVVCVSVYVCVYVCMWVVCGCEWIFVYVCAHIHTWHPILRNIADQQGCSINKPITQDTSAEKQIQAICYSFPGCFISLSLGVKFPYDIFSRKHNQLVGW